MSRRMTRLARRARYHRFASIYRRRFRRAPEPERFPWVRALILIALPTGVLLAATWITCEVTR